MLMKLSEILGIAGKKQIANGTFNCPNLESLQDILSA
jgi:Fructose/tagatose bisphosphate aldolase